MIINFLAITLQTVKMIIDTISENDMNGFIKDRRKETAQRIEYFKAFNT